VDQTWTKPDLSGRVVAAPGPFDKRGNDIRLVATRIQFPKISYYHFQLSRSRFKLTRCSAVSFDAGARF
jgi:hypothetical protein